MSQEKVDYNKKQKQNRKKLVKRRKMQNAATVIAGLLVLAALGGWIGFSVYTNYQEEQAANPTYYDLDLSGLTDYLSNLD
jgi:cell division protein FtsB